MGGGVHQQTWASIFNETRFSGEMIRNPLFGLIAYGMIFLSIILVICLADNNLLDFAVTQHNEAQAKRAKEMAEAESKAEEAAISQSNASQGRGAPPVASQDALPQQSVQDLLPQSAPSQGFSSQSPAQPGYLQQSLLLQGQSGNLQSANQSPYQTYQQGSFPGYAQQSGGGYPQSGAYQSSGAYMQGGYKTGPDGTTRVPMNRMVVNR